MAFVQIIEFTTSRKIDVEPLFDKWLAATAGKRTARRLMLTSDRDTPNTYLEIVEFASYDEAMRNSNLPETQAMGAEMAELCDSGPTFRNLDVMRTVEG